MSASPRPSASPRISSSGPSNPTGSGVPAVIASPPSGPPPTYEERSLPAGWSKEFDPKTNRHFYVDTLAEPPRSIWVHPLDDPDFIRLHRQVESDDDLYDDDHSDSRSVASRRSSDARRSGSPQPPDHAPPSSPGKLRKGQDSYPDEKRSRRSHEDDHLQVPQSTPGAGSSSSVASSSNSGNSKGKKRGFFGKLKDKAIGTKEEREAHRKAAEARRREEERLYYERRDAMLAKRMQELENERAAYEKAGIPWDGGRYGGGYGGNGYYGNGNGYGSGYPGGSSYQQSRYGPPVMNAYGGPTYQDPYTYGQSPYYGGGRRGGGGLGGGAGLVGGLVGGLLLTDLLLGI